MACIFNGVGVAAQPILSTNFGAGQSERVRQTLKLGLLTSVAFGILFAGAVLLAPETVLKIYMDVDEGVLAVGPSVMRIYFLGTFVTGVSIFATYYFQAVLRRGMCTLISLMRGIILPVLFATVLSGGVGPDALWWSIPLSELITFLAVLVMLFIASLRREDRVT
jgi:Na+-driven multidrug efflux pump